MNDLTCFIYELTKDILVFEKLSAKTFGIK